MTANSYVQRLDRLTNLLLGVILFIPFVISAGALTDMARRHGVSLPWLYPFLVDGGLIIFKALALRASLRGKRDWYAWTLAAALTAVSVLLNVRHVPAGVPDRTLASLMAALPPAVILASFIAVSRRVEETARWQTAVHTYQQLVRETESQQAELDHLLQEKKRLAQTMQASKANNLPEKGASTTSGKLRRKSSKSNGKPNRKTVNKTAAMDALLAYVSVHPDATLQEIGQHIGRAKSTAGVYVSELVDAERLAKNGHGWEVLSAESC